MNHSEMTSALNDLLTRSYDAVKGYEEAANEVNHLQLRQWMHNNAENRKTFISELENQIKNLGGTPDRGSSFLSSLHRIWIEYKANITDGDEAVLEECIRGEERAVEDYDKVLNNVTFDTSINSILTRQRNDIKESLNSLRAIESTLAVTQ
ncbi:MAG: PA2169 family four-helix-bundle protein [Bacteroidota bacterium]